MFPSSFLDLKNYLLKNIYSPENKSDATYLLEKSWAERVEICHLYPLLVHLNLFGRSYLSGIEAVVRRF